jgi:hypothetical protein
MATTASAINASAFVSPVTTGGTGNSINTLKSFQLLRSLANTQNASFRDSLLDQTYTTPSDTELVNLSPQALDILNGIAPKTEKALSNINQPIAQQPVSIVPEVPLSASNFFLTQLQRENLASIIGQFANAPFNMNTFLQIQNALVAARINPQQISLQGILQQVFARALPASYFGKAEVEEQVIEQEAA